MLLDTWFGAEYSEARSAKAREAGMERNSLIAIRKSGRADLEVKDTHTVLLYMKSVTENGRCTQEAVWK